MQTITLQQAADFLETALIEKTIDVGHALVHIGTNQSNQEFVMLNDCEGNAVLYQSH